MLRTLILSLALILPMAAHAAEDPRVLTWDDLVPEMAEVHNPFEELDPNDREKLGFILRTREDLKLGFLEEDSEDYVRAQEIAAEMKAAGIDPDALLAAGEEMMAEIERRGAMVDTSLGGKLIRMPGYALPLEQSPDGVTEFLLVPYVGACIHVPPPPANQIVYVTLPEAYRIANLYEPVWITGTLQVEAASRNLSFIDGAGAGGDRLSARRGWRSNPTNKALDRPGAPGVL